MKNWLQENFHSEGTRKTYLQALQDFGHIDIKSPYELERELKSFIIQKRNQGNAPKTIRTKVFAVISYYKSRGVRLSPEAYSDLKRRLLPKGRAITRDRAGKPEDWKRILSFMSLQGRSLFLFLLSSGCRIQETLQLRIEDFYFEEDPPGAYIPPYYAKDDEGRVVFFTYEARDHIKMWLDEKLMKDKRSPHVIVLPNGERIKGSSRNHERVWDFSESTAREMLYSALEKSGMNDRDPRTHRYKIHVHSTRKFFKTNCGLEEADTHLLMGHAGGYLDSSYHRREEEDLADAYRAAIPRLTIFERPTMDKVEMIKSFAESLGIKNIDIKIAKLRDEGIEETEAIGRLIRESLTLRKERKLVSEEELPAYLNQGYEIEHVLNTKIVVAK